MESNLEEDSDGDWVPHVRYVYMVEKKRYVSDQLYFYRSSINTITEQDAQEHLSPYPVGKTVTIYYNPRKPEEAVLDRRVPLWLPLLQLLAPSVWLVAGAAAMWRE